MKKFLVIMLVSFCGFTAVPQPVPNYVPVVLVNSSNQDPSTIYFVAHALDPCGLPCYLVPDGNGICQYVYPNPSGTPSSADPAISKTLSQLPSATGTSQTDPAYLIYMPINSSARGYLSIANPMYLATVFNPAPSRQVLDINDSSVTSLQDPNYYTWYQDFEFGLVYINTNVATGANLTSQLFLNLSWVDYFCLPMKLEVYSYPSNTPIQGISTLVAGFDPTTSRDTILADIQSGLVTPWDNLSIPYYNNQYSSSTIAGYLRILAAKNSISLASSPQFQGATSGASQTFFPDDYVHNTAYGPTASSTFMEEVASYYAANTLNCQIFPAGGQAGFAYTYAITASGSTMSFTPTWTPDPPLTSTFTLNLSTLTTEELLSGSLWPFVPDNDPSFTNELSKLISAIFTIGQLPLNTGQMNVAPPLDYGCSGPSVPTATIVVNNCGFSTIAPRSGQRNSYFHNPDPLNPSGTTFGQGPWYNVYDEYLHKYQIVNNDVPNNPDYGLGYGYDYDDLLNMAGLINPGIQTEYATPASNGFPSVLPNAYVVITLGNLSGTPILNINNDQYTTNPSGLSGYQTIPYPVAVGALSANSTMVVNFHWYNGTTTNVTPAPPSGTTTLANLVADPSHLFQIEFQYNDVTYTYNINLLRQIVTPSSPSNPYSAVDQALIDGITFTLESGVLTINMSSVEPPWPG